ncbi:MAG: glucoamylase family protein [Acholeplasmataceae bacterium]|jgi:hypothetical protein|nr:glucoamylase family protein [Acholeplasmataceae bacterium]
MDKIILKELHQKAYQFFQDYTNFNLGSKGYGLTPDHSNRLNVASIAATGFMLSSLVIGVNQNYLDYEEAKEKTLGTLKTLYFNVPHQFGFFAHFLDIETAERYQKCEYSTIDTVLALCGILTVDSFFKDEEITRLTYQIISRINWEEFIFEKEGKVLFRMAYNPDKDGDYVLGKPGFIHQWDMFAEQLIKYVMIAGLIDDKKMALRLYEGFHRRQVEYDELSFIGSPHNTLFVYHFPLAWLDIKNMIDSHQISWFENAKQATLSHQKSAIMYKDKYKGFSEYLFGCNASDTPKGYRVFGSIPNVSMQMDTDGTIAPFSMIGALPLIPEIIYQSILHMKAIDHLEGQYGFYDAFNLTSDTPWISSKYISIDKGLELLMLDAYLYQNVYQAFMKHPIIIEGLTTLGFKNKK